MVSSPAAPRKRGRPLHTSLWDTPGLAAVESTARPEAFGAVCGFLAGLGAQLAGGPAGELILISYALPFLLPLLRTAKPLVAPEVLKVAYAFVPPTPEKHIEVIRELQDKLDDQSTFVTLIPHLSALERDFSDDLFNLYKTYLHDSSHLMIWKRR